MASRHKTPAAPRKGAAVPSGPDGERIRIDKWLFFARFFRSRGLAAGAVSSGAVRVNGELAGRASRMVGAGDVLTFVMGGEVRVVRLLHCGVRRGPAPEARGLYAWISGEPAQAMDLEELDHPEDQL